MMVVSGPCSWSSASVSRSASWPSSASRSPERAISSMRSCGVSSRSPTVRPMLRASRGWFFGIAPWKPNRRCRGRNSIHTATVSENPPAIVPIAT